VEVLRHHPGVSWLEDYLEEVEEIMGKDPWIHGIAEDSPALKFLDFLGLKGCFQKHLASASCLPISEVSKLGHAAERQKIGR
jgi:hypothetical protein